MKVVLQRVHEAEVTVENEVIGGIDRGICLFQGIEEGDSRSACEELTGDVLDLRVFPDDEQQMNRDLQEVAGDLLIVPNFTLCARLESGNRPGFGNAADSETAEDLFDYTVNRFRSRAPAHVASGKFGAMMDVAITNNGPVTFMLDY